ncbi:MAG: hypothetical protein ABJC09_14230 [Terriglobia bacterium]
MDEELRQYLGRIYDRLEDLHTQVDRIEGLQKQVDGKFDAARTQTSADIEKSETNLLRAFHGWARSMDIRVRGVSGLASGFEERLGSVEERVSELERRKAS